MTYVQTYAAKRQEGKNMEDWLQILVIAVIAIILLTAVIVVIYYNGFVKKKLKVENNFSQIKIQCKKRFDLIPNLVETVRGYAKHESETLENVTAARNRAAAANNARELAKANNELTSVLGRLFAVAEAYPELKAGTNFTMLQSELSDIEKAIASARSFYNDSVMIYNTAVRTFPGNIFASMLGFKKEEFFDAPEEELQNVKVGF
jgi:LemA protein